MITFKSTEDLAKLPPDHFAYPTVKELVDRLITEYTTPGHTYDWEAYGFVILIEESDVDRELVEIWDGARLTNLYWEGIAKQGDFFIGLVLLNNEAAHCYIIPDAPWVNGELRELIEDILDPVELTHEEET